MTRNRRGVQESNLPDLSVLLFSRQLHTPHVSRPG